MHMRSEGKKKNQMESGRLTRKIAPHRCHKTRLQRPPLKKKKTLKGNIKKKYASPREGWGRTVKKRKKPRKEN